MTPGAFGQIPELDIGDPDSFQGGNAIACFFDHTANLSIPAFFELDEKSFAGKPLNNGGAGFFSKNGDAFSQYCERTVGHGGRNGHDVFLFMIKGRVQHMVVEVSVIGPEQERATGNRFASQGARRCRYGRTVDWIYGTVRA